MNTQDEINRLEIVIANLSKDTSRITFQSKKAIVSELEAKILVLKFLDKRGSRRATPCGWGRLESRIDKFTIGAE